MDERLNARYRRLSTLSLALSLLFLAALLGVYVAYGSILALGQAADSFIDVFTSTALLVSLRVSAQPADRNHPRGHHRAEPIAALVTAVLAGVLSIEVFRAAITSLVTSETAVMDPLVAMAFGAKILGRFYVFLGARKKDGPVQSPAMNALALDARNDLVLGTLALLGFFAAKYRFPSWDAWLAMPIASWIAWSGFGLAMDNVRLLMGGAADVERQQALKAMVDGCEGILESHDFHVRHEGVGLEVIVSIVLDESLSLREAHDIGVAVEERLLREPDVVGAAIHIDVDGPVRGSQPTSSPRAEPGSVGGR